MIKIAALHAFIEALNLVDSGQIFSDVDDLEIRPCGRGNGLAGQLIMSEKHYTATFYIERYPHGQIGEDVLFDNISAWLIDNDSNRTEGFNFPVVVDVLDESVADIEFRISFLERSTVVEDVDGPITFDGVRYGYL
jgi:hypothetical protein